MKLLRAVVIAAVLLPVTSASAAVPRLGHVFLIVGENTSYFWDEGADPPKDPGHVGALLLGPLVRPWIVDRTRHNHYGLERTLAAGFAAKPLARAKHAKAIATIWADQRPARPAVSGGRFLTNSQVW